MKRTYYSPQSNLLQTLPVNIICLSSDGRVEVDDTPLDDFKVE